MVILFCLIHIRYNLSLCIIDLISSKNRLSYQQRYNCLIYDISINMLFKQVSSSPVTILVEMCMVNQHILVLIDMLPSGLIQHTDNACYQCYACSSRGNVIVCHLYAAMQSVHTPYQIDIPVYAASIAVFSYTYLAPIRNYTPGIYTV